MTTENKRYIVLPPDEKPTKVHAKSINVNDDSNSEIPLVGSEQGLSNFNVERQDYFESEFNTSDQDVTIKPSGSVDRAYEIITDSASQTQTYLFDEAINKSSVGGTGNVVRSGTVDSSAFTWKPDTHTQYKLRESHNGFQKLSETITREFNSASAQRSFARPSLLPLSDGNLICGFLNNRNAPWGWTYADFLMTEANTNGSISGDPIINSPSGRYISSTIRLQLFDRKKGAWKTQSVINNSFVDAGGFTSAGATSIDQLGYLGVTGLSFVQYPDSDEVLAIYCGFVGASSHSFRKGYLCVDEIVTDFSDMDSFGFNQRLDTENRCKAAINNDDDAQYFNTVNNQQSTRDIPGLGGQHTKPIGLSADILPSGRLVVVVAYEDGIYSLVSDDRGRTFQATQVMDTLFGDQNYRQRVSTVSTCVLDSGSIALLITANGIGSRSGGLNTQARPGGQAASPESVISVFVSGDGVNWGSEKRLGGGAYQPTMNLTDTNDAAAFTFPNDFRRHAGENLYPLSGSILQTPDKFILVSVVGLSLGGPGLGSRQGIYQRTLSVNQLTGGEKGLDLAPSWHPVIADPQHGIASISPRFNPATKNINNYLDQGYSSNPPTSSRSIIFRRFAEAVSYGEVTHPNIGFVGTNTMFCTPVGRNYVGPMSYGGGPILSQGSIDIATCVYNDAIVTADCWLMELGMGNSFPNADQAPIKPGESSPTTMSNASVSSASGLQSHEQAVRIQYSGGWTPAYCRRPTELRWYSRLYQPCGYATEQYNDSWPPFIAGQSTVDFQTFLGSNAWQINLVGGLNPQYQSWDWIVGQGTPTISRISAEDDGYSALENTTIVANTGDYGYLEFGKQLTTSIAKKHFPNSTNTLLQTTPTFPYLKDVGGHAFIARIVVLVAYGGTVTGGGLAESRTMSVSVRLKDERGTSGSASELLCSWGRESDKVHVRLDVNSTSGLSNFQTLTVTDPSEIQGSHNVYKRNFTEIIFGQSYARPTDNGVVTPTLYPFVMARPLNRINDPDLTADFTCGPNSTVSYTTPYTINSYTAFTDSAFQVADEHIRIGGALSGGSDNGFALASFQFSRSFLRNESPAAAVYEAVDSSDGALPRGDNFWDESSRLMHEAAIQTIKQNNGGVFSPMKPTSTTSAPQYIERGLHLGIAGRFAKDSAFTYKSTSSFQSEHIFNTPVLQGFRGAADKITPSIQFQGFSGEVTFNPTLNPSVEILFDFGDRGVLPEAFAMFGCNSPEIALQFLNESDLALTENLPFGVPGNRGKSLVLLCGTPDSGVARAWQRIQGPPCQYLTSTSPGTFTRYQDTPVTYKPRYEFVAGDYVLAKTGLNEQIVSSDHRVYSPQWGNTASDNPYKISFALNHNQSNKAQAPFRPHQFRSNEKESYYLQIMPRESFDVLSGSSPRFCFDNFMKQMVPYTHIYKIKDNGRDWVELTSKWTDMFSQTSQTGKLVPGFITIYSDRAGYNVPDYFPTLDGSGFNKPPIKKYRFARVILGGGQFHDPNEQFIRLNGLIMGKRLELSTRDIDVQYTYDIKPNSKLFTGSTGLRASRKNSEPRRSFQFSYSPRPSSKRKLVTDSKQMADGNEALGFEYDIRGYGSTYQTNAQDNRSPEYSEQRISLSHLSWEEIVERILRIGINGDVVALAFDGNRMINLHSNQTEIVPGNATISPAESSPNNLIPARLTNYGGAANVGYMGRTVLKTDSGASSGSTNSTECRPAPIMKINNIKFEEEF